MERIRLTDQTFQDCVKRAVSVLRRGGVIAYPTETVYGLGCDPRNTKALQRLHRIKGLEQNKPLLLVASSVVQVKKVAKLNNLAADLALRFWPGPLTLVVPSLTSKKDIAVRVSSSEFVHALTRAYGFPIVSTSANLSGQQETRSGRAAFKAFQNHTEQPDLIIDAGALVRRKTSTIARVTAQGRIEILRQGAVRRGILLSYDANTN